MLRRRKRDEPQSRKPEDSDFKQQRLRSWEPLLTPFWVISTFLSIGLLFLIIGVVVLDASNSVVEIEKQYKLQQPLCDLTADPPQTDCCDITDPSRNPGFCTTTVTFEITEQMRPPIYVYYKLTDFYQNHRRYVKSRSDDQLRGESGADTSLCDPLERMGNMTLYPCGLVANSIFNDTLAPPTLSRPGEPDLVLENDNWSNRGIAWRSDMEHKFRNRTMDEDKETNVGPNGPLPAVGTEELAVWMRTAGLPNFKKLHRIIKRTSLLKGDTLTLDITDVFQVRGFGGSKSVILSTSSWLGGKNSVLANAYLVVGILCFVAGLIFLGLHVFHRRDLGDMKYWNWRS